MKTITVTVDEIIREVKLSGQSRVGDLAISAIGNSFFMDCYEMLVDGKPADRDTFVTEENTTVTLKMKGIVRPEN